MVEGGHDRRRIGIRRVCLRCETGSETQYLRRFHPRSQGGTRRRSRRRPPTATATAVGSTVPPMVSVEAAARLALDLPEVTEGQRHGNRTWSVAGKAFAVGAAVQQGRHPAVRRSQPARRPDSRGSCRGSRREGERCSPRSQSLLHHRTSTGTQRF
jgi:hypothetical protein